MTSSTDLRRPTAPTTRRAGTTGNLMRPAQLVVYLCFGAVALSSISAFAWVINASMKTNTEFLQTSPWSAAESLRWQNYANAWESAHVGTFFGNSLLVSVSATALGVVVAAFAAYPLARIPFRFNGAVLTLFLLGLMVPWMVTFIPLYQTMAELGLLDTRLGLVLVYATYNLPFNIFVLVGFMRTLPHELEESAAVDGAGPTRTFVSVIAPLLGPGLASVTIISFLQNWNEFFYALVLIHTKELMTLPLGLFQLGQAADYGTNWAVLFAGMVITVVPVLIICAVLHNRITKGLTAGALKG